MPMLDDMHWALSMAIIFSALIFLFAIGMPVGFAIGFVAIVGLVFSSAGLNYALDMMTSYTYTKVTPFIFVCMPLFVLMTEIMSVGGISKRMVEMAHIVMGRFPGSLAAVAVIAATIFGAISGAAVIGVITISDMLLPECMKRGYDKSLIAGAIAAGGTMSYIIPPSFMFILWAIISGVSIEKQFMAGIIPGFLLATMFVIYIVIRTKRNPALAPMPPPTSTKQKLLVIAKGWQVVVIIVVVLGGVYSGAATVVEVSGVAAFTAVILALINRELSFRNLLNAFQRTAEMIASFIMIIVGAYLLIHLINYLEIPQNISESIVDADLSSTLLVLVIMVLFFVLGMFIDAGSVMLVVMPLFLESLKAMNVDLIWLGVLVAISCMIAELTPPVGLSLFIIQSVGKFHGISYLQIVRGVIPFMLIMILGLALILAFPSIATWLPSTMD